MDYALKNGCQQAKVNLYAGSNSSFELRDAKMDRLQQASGKWPDHFLICKRTLWNLFYQSAG